MIIIPLTTIFTVPFFYDASHYKVSDVESDLHERLIGKEYHEQAIENTQSTYRKYILPMSNWMCATEVESNIDTSSFNWIIKQANKSRCQAIVRGIYRVNVELHFLIGVFLLAIAAFFDGAMQRFIKKYEFGYNNTVTFNLVTHGIIFILGLTFVAVFLPIVYSSMYYFSYSSILIIFAWLMSSNFQTGA